MSESHLTCEETPVAWPATVDISDLDVCSMCGLQFYATQAGSLQVLTRRQGAGVGDGVNVDESSTIAADYRGQRYLFEEAVLHIPGLHVFPKQTAPYSAEYHVHMKTLSEPKRFLTVVIPATHNEELVSDGGAGKAYFAAITSKPEPGASRPRLSSLIPAGAEFIQYVGPDLRGRTRETANEKVCAAKQDRQFLLMLSVASIRAADLERIPREGSLSSDPEDLPASGVRPTANIARDRLLKMAILARPGVITTDGKTAAKKQSSDCPTPASQKPKQEETPPAEEVPESEESFWMMLGISAAVAIVSFAIFDYIASFFWGVFFTTESYVFIKPRTNKFYILKLLVVFLAVVAASVV